MGEPAFVREKQTANLLGALSRALTDRVDASMRAAAGERDTSAAMLSALFHFLDEPSTDLLSQVLGLSHSGAVRLVDRLEAAGYVGRKASSDKRITAVALTAKGRRVARKIAQARTDTLQKALEPLSAEERSTFGLLAGRILAGMVRPAGARRWMCRMCDTTACGRLEGHCPVANASGAVTAAQPST
jgi:DNA-binding MarR family transcriptional regulator